MIIRCVTVTGQHAQALVSQSSTALKLPLVFGHLVGVNPAATTGRLLDCPSLRALKQCLMLVTTVNHPPLQLEADSHAVQH